jgi:hypothetical protein
VKQFASVMTIQEATDYPGNDVDRLRQTTLTACVLACSENTVCKAITYIASRNECWLKDGIGSGRSTKIGRLGSRHPRQLGFGVMAALTPLGLIAPGRAFGEDAPKNLNLQKYHLDAVPSGLRHYAGFWHNTLFSGYGFSNDKHPVVGYLLSAAVGIAVIAAVVGLVLAVVRTRRRTRQLVTA